MLSVGPTADQLMAAAVPATDLLLDRPVAVRLFAPEQNPLDRRCSMDEGPAVRTRSGQRVRCQVALAPVSALPPRRW